MNFKTNFWPMKLFSINWHWPETWKIAASQTFDSRSSAVVVTYKNRNFLLKFTSGNKMAFEYSAILFEDFMQSEEVCAVFIAEVAIKIKIPISSFFTLLLLFPNKEGGKRSEGIWCCRIQLEIRTKKHDLSWKLTQLSTEPITMGEVLM